MSRSPRVKWKLSVRLSIFIIVRRDNSLVPKLKLRVMAVVELYANVTLYDQHLDALKSVYERRQSVMDGKLLPLICYYRTGFELAQRVFEIPKQVTLVTLTRHLSRKNH